MRIVLDRKRCRGSGHCWRLQPELLRRGGDGLCRIEDDRLDEVPAGVGTALAVGCPNGALTVEGDDDFYDFPNVGP